MPLLIVLKPRKEADNKVSFLVSLTPDTPG